MDGVTLAVRIRLADGIDSTEPIAGASDGEGRERIVLRLRVAGADPQLAETDRWQNYSRFADANGQATILECVYRTEPPAERLALLRADRDRARRADPSLPEYFPDPDMAEGIQRLGVPITLLHASAEIDVVVRATRARVELFVDGVLVDEEWPGSEKKPAPLDLAWNAWAEDASEVRHWDYALADAEIIERAGGAAAVEKRRQEILGPKSPIAQYWAPPGHNTWAGDVMLAGDADRLHLFWLTDRRMGNSKFGCGAAQFAHAVAVDLHEWEHRPLAMSISEPWEASLGTGCAVPAGDGLHVFANVLTERLGIADRYPTGVYSGLIRDGVGPSVKQGFRGFTGEPGIIRDSVSGVYHAVSSSRHADGIWRTSRYESADLLDWRLADPDFLPQPGWPPTRTVFSSECFCWFAWRGWWYILGGRTGYWKSRALLGPYRDVHSLHPDAPKWDVYDGLMVPQATVYRDRAILAGWLALNPTDWAGHLAFRELLQGADGDLRMRRLPEMEPSPSPVQSLTWKPGDVPICLPPDAGRLRLVLDHTRCMAEFGLRLTDGNNGRRGADLIIDPAAQTARWATPQPVGIAPATDDPAYNGGDFAIRGLERLDQPIALDVIIHHDPKSASLILDAQINGSRTLITRRPAFSPMYASLLATDGAIHATGEACVKIDL